MKIVYNDWIPFPGFRAINLFGVLFARRDAGALTPSNLGHEAIHTAQMRELLYVPFYLIYFVEWLLRLLVALIRRRPLSEAYYRIRFEHEAYTHQSEADYLRQRKRWAMWR